MNQKTKSTLISVGQLLFLILAAVNVYKLYTGNYPHVVDDLKMLGVVNTVFFTEVFFRTFAVALSVIMMAILGGLDDSAKKTQNEYLLPTLAFAAVFCSLCGFSYTSLSANPSETTLKYLYVISFIAMILISVNAFFFKRLSTRSLRLTAILTIVTSCSVLGFTYYQSHNIEEPTANPAMSKNYFLNIFGMTIDVASKEAQTSMEALGASNQKEFNLKLIQGLSGLLLNLHETSSLSMLELESKWNEKNISMVKMFSVHSMLPHDGSNIAETSLLLNNAMEHRVLLGNPKVKSILKKLNHGQITSAALEYEDILKAPGAMIIKKADLTNTPVDRSVVPFELVMIMDLAYKTNSAWASIVTKDTHKRIFEKLSPSWSAVSVDPIKLISQFIPATTEKEEKADIVEATRRIQKLIWEQKHLN